MKNSNDASVKNIPNLANKFLLLYIYCIHVQFHMLSERQYSKPFKLNCLRQFSFITKLNCLYCTNN